MQFNIEEATKAYEAMRAGKFTHDEWREYCARLLDLLMEENKSVLENLKNS